MCNKTFGDCCPEVEQDYSNTPVREGLQRLAIVELPVEQVEKDCCLSCLNLRKLGGHRGNSATGLAEIDIYWGDSGYMVFEARATGEKYLVSLDNMIRGISGLTEIEVKRRGAELESEGEPEGEMCAAGSGSIPEGIISLLSSLFGRRSTRADAGSAGGLDGNTSFPGMSKPLTEKPAKAEVTKPEPTAEAPHVETVEE